MADINSGSHSHPGSLIPYHNHLPQAAGQEAGFAGLAAVPQIKSGAASCMAEAATKMPDRLLRLPDVIARVGIHRAMIYQRMAAGTFPKNISLGSRAVGWLESAIEAWVAGRVAEAMRRRARTRSLSD